MRKIFAISLIFVFSCACENKTESAPPQEGTQRQNAEVPVEFHKTIKQSIPVSSQLPGRVRAFSTAEIRPQVNGIILERLFEQGSRVVKGQQLYQIDPARYQAAYEMARARLQSAEATLARTRSLKDRYEKLIKQNAISRQEHDDVLGNFKQAQAEVELAQAQVKDAEIDLGYTKVFSPISGYIGKTSFTKGALVSAGQATPLAVVRQLDPVYVDLSQPSSEAFLFRQKLGGAGLDGQEGIEVSLKLEDGSVEYRHKGKLEARELSVEEQSGSVEMRAVFPNPETALLPGMFVRAYVEEIGVNELPLVPQKALLRDRNGDAFVWIIREDKSLEKRRVETGSMHNDSWTITSGLEGGERVALDNLSKLGPDVTVSPIKSERMGE